MGKYYTTSNDSAVTVEWRILEFGHSNECYDYINNRLLCVVAGGSGGYVSSGIFFRRRGSRSTVQV